MNEIKSQIISFSVGGDSVTVEKAIEQDILKTPKHPKTAVV